MIYAAGMGSLIAFGFFSVACPLVLGLIAMRYSIIVGLIACAAMCVTLHVKGMQFDQRIGAAPDSSGRLGMVAVLFVVAVFLSLIVSIPLTLASRRNG